MIFDIQDRRQQLTPKVVWLESENFDEAQAMIDQKVDKSSQWKSYLNALAKLGFEKWLRERRPDIKIYRGNKAHEFDNISYLNVDKFSLCLITLDSLIDNFITVPSQLITSAEAAAHFYVLIEVLEEEEQLNIHGFLRYDQLQKYQESTSLNAQTDSCYKLPLSWFDPEINNLLLCTRFLEPNAISLPSAAKTNNTVVLSLNQVTNTVRESLVNLKNWQIGVFEEGWLSLENFVKPSAHNIAWGYARSKALEYQDSRAKKIDFGVSLHDKKCVLVINFKQVKSQEIDVLVKVIPDYSEGTGNPEYLPPGLKLKVTLNPNSPESVSREVTARKVDNAIQLEFSEAPDKEFKVEVSY